MKKKLFAAATMSAFLMMGTPASAEAAVPVTLPTFDVTLNGTVIENENRQYPLLVYNDITYVPMTYHDCRFLGLETAYNQADGLGINKSDLTGAYYEDTAAKKNNKRATAQLVSGNVKVNGKQIQNSRETYPLLLYRDVTYFPLTWRYAVEEFGWNYHFDSKTGLVITSTNQKTDSLTITDGRKEAEEYSDFDFGIDAQYLYYQGKQGVIYQCPLHDWADRSKRKIALQLEEDPFRDGYPGVSFQEQQGEMYYSFWAGNALSGDVLFCRVSDGQYPEDYYYGTYIDYGSFAIQIDRSHVGGYPVRSMTYIASDGTKRTLGSSNYYYNIINNSYDAKRNVLYVSAWQLDAKTGEPGKSYLYAVSLSDGSMKQLSDRSSEGFAVTKDTLYFIHDQQLYQIDLNTGEETWMMSGMDKWKQWVVTENGMYLTSAAAGQQLCFWDASTGKLETLHGKGILKDLSNQNGYIVALFEETTDNHSRILVFDANGKQMFTSSDVADKTVINENGLLVYRLAGTTQLVKVQL